LDALADELAALAAHLARRRGAILKAWRDALHEDPELNTGNAMPRAQLNDHVPAMLSAFERGLGLTDAAQADAAEEASIQGAAAHGLHRWQQGYDLREVARELGRLNECMVAELENHAASNPGLRADTMSTARREWARACTLGSSESTAQYFRLQQIEAAGHVRDLEKALEDIRELEQQRAELWQQAAHDLRGNLGVVANVTAGLTSNGVPEAARETFLRMLERNVHSLHHLHDDGTSLARQQAGRETRQLAPMDAADVLRDLCEGLKPLAAQRGLDLHCEGPAPFVVQGDAVKVRRLAQNLVINAIKYTRKGGVTVTWGDSDRGDGKRWALTVIDTGPGFHAGPGAPLTGALEEATHLAEDGGSTPPARGDATNSPLDTRPVHQGPGEGIGLSIVKRLGDLLDATIEVESDPATGTSFRILLPRQYAPPG
jgi:signal transduction histidine kinase